MYRKNEQGVNQLFCDHCDKLIVGIAWGDPTGNYCCQPCRQAGPADPEPEKGEATMATRKPTKQSAKKQAAKPKTKPAPKPEAAAPAEGKSNSNRRSFKLPDETKIPKLPSKSPFEDAHQTAMFRLLKRCGTVGEFRVKVKEKGLYRDVRDAHFCNTLYAMVRAASAEE